MFVKISVKIYLLLLSLPPRGAWIEIHLRGVVQRQAFVAPPTGSVDYPFSESVSTHKNGYRPKACIHFCFDKHVLKGICSGRMSDGDDSISRQGPPTSVPCFLAHESVRDIRLNHIDQRLQHLSANLYQSERISTVNPESGMLRRHFLFRPTGRLSQ